MKLYKVLKSLLKPFFPEFLWLDLKKRYVQNISEHYSLIKKPEDVFERLYHISLDIWLVQDAIVCQNSDVIRCNAGVWWDKYNDYDFMTRAKPCDKNILSYTTEDMYVLPCHEKVKIQGVALSLLGVFVHVWSHFVFQYLCKLYYAGEAGLLNQNITILIYDYADKNINEILENYLVRYPKVKIIRTQANVDYYCEKLICAPALATNYNDARFSLDYGFVIPHIVIETLMRELVNPYTSKFKQESTKYTKLFLTRSSQRILSNKEEVLDYFRERGFCIVEGADLSMEEKASLFYNAKEIVGMHSSAWQNLIFCNNVRCLMMTNYRYSTETCFYTMAKKHVAKWINVTGIDESSELKTNYYIPLDRIKAAYEELIR